MKNKLFWSFILITLISCSKKNVSLIISNARIYTADSTFSQASAMAINDGKIVAIGNNVEIQTKYKSSNNIDAKGNTIFPGFIDAHCHFTGYATDKWKCELFGTTSYQQIIDKIIKGEDK